MAQEPMNNNQDQENQPTSAEQEVKEVTEEKLTEEQIESVKEKALAQLETVIDPELGVDVVNLGLIYDLIITEEGLCLINMTLTAMGCPLADVLTDDIHRSLADIPEIKKVDVQLVWYPAWTTDRMSRYARIALGIR